MGKKFNLGEYLDKAESKLDTGPRLISVELHLIDADPKNFYSMSGIDELADNIALMGLMQPLQVRMTPDGRYVVVSGHRRRAALRQLVDRGEIDAHFPVPCFLEQAPDVEQYATEDNRQEARDALQQLRLIYANSDNRETTPADKTREVKELAEIFGRLKRLGYQFPGKLREHVAAAAHVSESRVARLSVIEKGLNTPALRELFERGALGENAAYEIARREPEVVARAEEQASFIARQKLDAVKLILDNLEKQISEDRAEAVAYNDGVKAMGAEVSKLDTKVDDYLAQRAEEDANFRELLLGDAPQFFKRLVGVCTRQDGIGMLKYSLGRSHTSWWHDGPCVDCSPKGVRLWGMGPDITRTWTEVYDVLCTIAINGTAWMRRDEPRAADSRPYEVKATEVEWPEFQTGPVPGPGRYLCKVDMGDGGVHEATCEWCGDHWTAFGGPLYEGMEIAAWWPLPKKG